MSVLIYFEKIEEDIGRYAGHHNYPEQLTKEEKSRGVLIDFIPEPESNGKIATLCYRYSKNEIFYKYTDPLPQPEIEQLKQQLNEQAIALAALIGGAA